MSSKSQPNKTQPMISVYDSKAQSYSPPQMFTSYAEVFRFFISVKEKNPEHHWAKYPSDFQPFHIANWDGELALIQPITPIGLGTLDSIDFMPPGNYQSPGNLERFPVADQCFDG